MNSEKESKLVTLKPSLFPLGQLVATRGVYDHLSMHAESPWPYVYRHVQGDWGDVCAEDAKLNRSAIHISARILSSYVMAGKKVWIITEADRRATTLLFPDEY